MDEITFNKIRQNVSTALKVALKTLSLPVDTVAKNCQLSWAETLRLFMNWYELNPPSVESYAHVVQSVLQELESWVIDRHDGLSPRESLCIRVYGMSDVYNFVFDTIGRGERYELCD